MFIFASNNTQRYNKTQNNKTMTLKEIDSNLGFLSHTMRELADACYDNFGDPVIMLTGEMLRNMSYTVSMAQVQMKMGKEE